MKIILEKNYKTIIFFILLFVLIASVLNAYWDSAIFDETAHIPAGYSYIRYGDMRLNPEHPPLIKDLAGLPLVFMDLRFDTTRDFWAKDVNGQWDAGRHLLWQAGNDGESIVFWSRIPIIILSIILGLFIFQWTRALSGILAGLFALVLYAFDPNVLGHNHFVTTDLGIAAFGAFSFYYFLRFIKKPVWKNVFLGGVFLALVQLAKFSSVILFPVFGLILLVYPLIKNSGIDENNWKLKIKNLGEYLGKGAIAFLFSLILVWGVYALNTYKMPQEKLAETINFYFAPDDVSAKAVYTNKALTALNNNAITRPMSEYILGIAMVFKRVEGGNGAYFMGQVSGKAFPAYFPVVFLLKEPLPILFFMLSAFAIALVSIIKSASLNFKNNKKEKLTLISCYIRNHITGISLFSFIVLYSYISVTGNLNIGFRHLFPILPFAYILTAKIIFDFWKKMGEKQNRIILGSSILFLSILLMAETAASYPSYMSYFNKLAGGPKNGYRYVTDSNADWGQDLKRLQFFLADHPEIDKIRVDYFGGADIKYYIGDRYLMWWDSKRPIEPGWYAISTNFLQGSLYDKEKKDEDSYRWIKNIKPLYQVGTSIFIYHISKKDLENIQ
ncbi:MAG TPA: glycosyltransferase family 39 protein [Candidatus Moranbacteria bacterium]|nr:glycosyltransferase family 39 protein [Candidatus Moranbacteria bacterium]